MECTHGMPTPASCVACMLDGNLGPPKKKTEVIQADRSFTASYGGWCSLGHDEIVPDEKICSLSDGTYAHEECVGT